MFFSGLIIFRYPPKVSARGKMMGGFNNNTMVCALGTSLAVLFLAVLFFKQFLSEIVRHPPGHRELQNVRACGGLFLTPFNL